MVKRAAPLLEILAQAKRGTPATAKLLDRSRTTLLSAGTDTVTLATLGQLNTAARGFGLAVTPPGDDWCRTAAAESKAQDETDLQAIDALRRLGCSVVAAPRTGMYSRVGWLDQASPLDSLGTTAQVVRYLSRAGQAHAIPNRAELQETYDSVWLPEARSVDMGTPTGAVYVMRLVAVAASLGARTPTALSWHRPPGDAGEALNRALTLSFIDSDKAAMRDLATQAAPFEQDHAGPHRGHLRDVVAFTGRPGAARPRGAADPRKCDSRRALRHERPGDAIAHRIDHRELDHE